MLSSQAAYRGRTIQTHTRPLTLSQTVGKQLIDANDATSVQSSLKFIQGVLDLRRHYDVILAEGLKEEGFSRAVSQALCSVVNSNPTAADCIAVYIDERLKNSAKEVTIVINGKSHMSLHI